MGVSVMPRLKYKERLRKARPELSLVGKFLGMRKKVYVKDELNILYHVSATDLLRAKSISSEFISKLERKLHTMNKKYKYLPKTEFSGFRECFSNINKIKSITNGKIS